MQGKTPIFSSKLLEGVAEISRAIMEKKYL